MTYPTSVMTYGAGGFSHVNAHGSSTIVGAISPTSTTIVVNDATATTTWPTANFTVRIEFEVILITSRSGNTLTVGQRGYENTVAASHADTTPIITTFPATALEVLQSEMINVQNTLGITGSFHFFNAVSNSGTGTSLIASSTAPTLGLRSLKVNAPLTLSVSGNDIILSTSSGSTYTAANEGSGAQILDTSTSTATSFQFRTLVGAGGTTITASGNQITINSSTSSGFQNPATTNLNMNSFNIIGVNAVQGSTSTVSFSNSNLSFTGANVLLNAGSSGFVELTVNGSAVAYASSSLFVSNQLIQPNLGFKNSNGIQIVDSTVSTGINSGAEFTQTITWPVGFNDTNYRVFITAEGSGSGRLSYGVDSKTTSQVVLYCRNNGATISGTITFHFLGVRTG